MTPEKVLEVIGVYREFFEDQEVPKVKLSEEQFDEIMFISFEGDEKTMLAHCHQMLDGMEVFVREERMEKCFRWLGFIQGVLWSSGNFDLNELKNHNRPDEGQK